jgi:hypothetical protein
MLARGGTRWDDCAVEAGLGDNVYLNSGIAP